MKLFDLTGKKALVVGGAGDIGCAISEGLSEAGAAVVIIDIDDKVSEIARAVNAQGLQVDVQDREAIKKSIFDGDFETGIQ